MEKFGEYDIKKLKEAAGILLKVLEYNYCYGPLRRMVRRLDTIVVKLNELIDMNEEEGGTER